jgi:hypothetical protein
MYGSTTYNLGFYYYNQYNESSTMFATQHYYLVLGWVPCQSMSVLPNRPLCGRGTDPRPPTIYDNTTRDISAIDDSWLKIGSRDPESRASYCKPAYGVRSSSILPIFSNSARYRELLYRTNAS